MRPSTLSARLPVVFCFAVVAAIIFWCLMMQWGWNDLINLMSFVFSRMRRLRCRREQESAEEDEVVRMVQNPWFYRVIPRRWSARSSTLATPTHGDDLPEGWERRQAQNGRFYYVDHRTKVTTWNHPRTQLVSPRPAEPSVEMTEQPAREDV